MAPQAAPAPVAPEAPAAPQAAPAPPFEAEVPEAPPAPAPQAVPVIAPVAPPKGSFLAALVAAGYGNLSVDDIIALKNSGITAQFLAGVTQSGWTKLTPRELI